MLLRPARPTDTDRLGRILAATGAELPAPLDAYLDVVAAHGALLVCQDGALDDVVGFGGVIDLDDGGALVTDLFVHPDAQGRGVGGTILDGLLGTRPRRTTFSSTHAAALPTYLRRGMVPRWTLQYRSGVVHDLGSVDAGGRGPDAVEVEEPTAPAASLLSRSWLVRWFVEQGARSFELRDPGGRVEGAAIVEDRPDGTCNVLRLVTTGDHAAAITAVLRRLGEGTGVSCCVPAHSPAVAVLDRLGFAVVDTDTCCSTEPEPMPSHLVALHPGLG